MTTGLPVAQLMATIGLNTAPLVAGMTEAKGIIGGGSLAMGAAVAGIGLVAAGVSAISLKMAGDLESSMTTIATGAGEDATKLGFLKQGVLELAKTTGTSTDQLVQGLYMIESGGFRTQKALDILKAAAEGAKVGNADLGVVADATDTILKNYGEHGMTAANAVNTLIATVAHGKTHMEEFSDSLAHVLPTAASAGIGLNDVMGAMATMTGQGTHAAEAATYLRQMIVALSAPGDQAKRVLESVGLSADKVARDMHTSLPMAIAEITEAVGKKFPIGSAGYVAAMREIAGGSRQMQGMLQLGGDHIKTFTQLTKDVASQVQKGGSNIEGWTLVQQTFNQKMAEAGESIKVLFIQLGEKLLPVATRFADWLGHTAVPAIQTAASWIGEHLGGAVKAITQQWEDWTKKGGPLYGVLQQLPGIAQKIGEYFGILGQIWQTQILPALVQLLPVLKIVGIVLGVVIVASIALMVGAILILVGAVTGVILIITKLVEWIVYAVTHIGDLQKAMLQAGHDIATGVINWFTHLQQGVEQKAREIASNVTKKFMDFQAGLMKWGHDTATGIINTLTSLPGKMLALGEQLIRSLAQGITNARHSVVSAVANIPLLGGIAGGISHVMDNVPHFATGGIAGLRGPELIHVGEREPEAIIPLSQLPSGMRSSSAFSGSGGGGTQTIVVQLVADGRKLAEVTLPHLHTVIRNATGVRR